MIYYPKVSRNTSFLNISRYLKYSFLNLPEYLGSLSIKEIRDTHLIT